MNLKSKFFNENCPKSHKFYAKLAISIDSTGVDLANRLGVKLNSIDLTDSTRLTRYNQLSLRIGLNKIHPLGPEKSGSENFDGNLAD